MTRLTNLRHKYQQWREGALGYALLWLLGIPIPILLLIYFMRGCT